jgi:beta-glucosidase
MKRSRSTTVPAIMALSPVLVNVVVAVTEPPVTIGGAATLSAWLAVTNVRQGMGVPAGWTAQPTSPTTFAVVAPHSSAHTTWQITTTTSPGSYSLSASASYHGARSGTATGTATVQVPYASLAAAYDNRGITDDANPTAGAFASSGKTYSAQALATAGITPGPLSHAGTTFTWPGGSPDNVEANGQAIALAGTGTALAFLGASTNGTQGGTGTVYYSDGTSQPFSLSFSDWWTPAPTDQVVATAAYINDPVAGRYPRFSYAGDAYLTTEGNVLRGLL